MVGKLVIFGIGYVLGAQGGREQLDEFVALGRKLLMRDDVRMVVNMARDVVEARIDEAAQRIAA